MLSAIDSTKLKIKACKSVFSISIYPSKVLNSANYEISKKIDVTKILKDFFSVICFRLMNFPDTKKFIELFAIKNHWPLFCLKSCLTILAS